MKFFQLNNISMRWQLMGLSAVLVIVPAVTIGILTLRTLQSTTYKQIEKDLETQALIAEKGVNNTYKSIQRKVDSDLSSANIILSQFGVLSFDEEADPIEITAINQVTSDTVSVALPVLKAGEQVIANDFTIVDQVQDLVGGTATIFQIIPQGLLRISTNVLKEDGERAVGTYIPTSSPVYKTIMQGDTYRGKAFVVNQNYYTAYQPLTDNTGAVVGVLYVGVSEAEYMEEFKEEFSQMVVGKTGYIFIIDTEGNYILSFNRKRDGENILGAKDANGVEFIKEIIEKGKTLKDGETAVQYYPWKNTGETTARLKLAGFAYNENVGWVIASSAYQADFLDGYNTVQTMLFTVVISSIVIAMILAFVYANSIANVFTRIKNDMSKVGQGDLNITFARNVGTNELGQLQHAFKIMVNSIQSLVGTILTNSQTISATAQQLASSSQQVNASTQQVSSGVQEIASGGENLAKQAADASKNTQELSAVAAKGGESAKVAENKMVSLASAVNESSMSVQTLGDKSQEIVKIVDTINSIASQTNLLALNAAIEAARAGEAGRGFAVVADEVRKLAEESQNATKDIEQLINEIKNSTEEAVASMDAGKNEVQEGSTVVGEALRSLDEIGNKVKTIESSIESVSVVWRNSLPVAVNR
jgi:methyl-accepting chemotaxis protein